MNEKSENKEKTDAKKVETKSDSQLKISWLKITSGWTFLCSWPAPSPMCMVRGCFLTILRRERSCFLHTEPLLEAQSCCRARLRQQTLPFPRPTLLHAAGQNVTTLARVLIELEWLACAYVHAEEKGETNKMTNNETCNIKCLPDVSWILEALPLSQCWPAEAVRVHVSILQSSRKATISPLWLNC